MFGVGLGFEIGLGVELGLLLGLGLWVIAALLAASSAAASAAPLTAAAFGMGNRGWGHVFFFFFERALYELNTIPTLHPSPILYVSP